MGLPYSKEIHYAFDQVTPLVACGFTVLETTRDISILVALIQAVTCLLLATILVALLALLITVNPDLELERQTIVTPAIRWSTSWVTQPEDRWWLKVLFLVVLGGIMLGTWAGWCYTMRDTVLVAEEQRLGDEVVGEIIEGTDTR